jgi:hypothetical protein
MTLVLMAYDGFVQKVGRATLFSALATGINSRSTIRSIRLYSICNPMKAIVEPRIVAVKIHGPARRAQGAAAGADKSTPSSQGCLMTPLNRAFELYS